MTADLTVAELSDVIHKLKTKKAPGKDGDCSEMIKHGLCCQEETTGALQPVLKHWGLSSGMGEAVVAPIFKKQKDPKQKDSHRTISLISCLGNILGCMINKGLLWHFELDSITIKKAITGIQDHIIFLTGLTKKKKKVIATFIDLSKALYKVWKDCCLVKLLNAGISGTVLTWIKSQV